MRVRPITTATGPTASDRSAPVVGGGASGADVRLFPPALFAVPFAMAALLHRRRPWPRRRTGDARVGRGTMRRGAGLTLIGGGAALMGWAFTTMHRQRTTVLPWAHVERLVRDGPFAHLRNPIYAADLLVYLGGSLLLRSAWPLLPLPVVLLVLRRRVIDPEEAYLQVRFGTTFAEYCREVPRLVPGT